MIEPSMVRILARMDAAALGRYAALSDPVLLGMGLCMYGFRVWSVSRAQLAAAQASDRPQDRGPAGGGQPGNAEPAARPVVVVGTQPPAEPDLLVAARNGVARPPIDILTGIESDNMGGIG